MVTVDTPNSSNITRFSYNYFTLELTITYHKTGDYTYVDVPRDVYNDLCFAESTGSFVNVYIKPYYKSVKALAPVFRLQVVHKQLSTVSDIRSKPELQRQAHNAAVAQRLGLRKP